MIPQLFFVPAMLYVCVYLFFVRRAVRGVRAIFAEYEKSSKLIEELGWDESITSVKLILDRTMPRDDFPRVLKRDIELARFFFYTSFPVCLVCWILMVAFST